MNKARPIRSMADERLDFNHFGHLRKSYIVAASYRSGSTYLCAKLWQTGLLGAPNEVLNPTFQLPALMTRLRASSHSDYIAQLLARRTSRNGVFGLKVHFRHFQLFMKAYPELLEVLSPVTYIQVTRQDKIAQAVSAARAWQTHYWNTLVQVRSPPRACYDLNLIKNCLRDIDEQETAWRRWFESSGIAPFEVSYEDYLGQPGADSPKHRDPAWGRPR